MRDDDKTTIPKYQLSVSLHSADDIINAFYNATIAMIDTD